MPKTGSGSAVDTKLGMVRAIAKALFEIFLTIKLAKYLGEGTSRRAAEGNFRCFSFCAAVSSSCTPDWRLIHSDNEAAGKNRGSGRRAHSAGYERASGQPGFGH